MFGVHTKIGSSRLDAFCRLKWIVGVNQIALSGGEYGLP